MIRELKFARNSFLLSQARGMGNAQRQPVKDMTALLFDDISNTIPCNSRANTKYDGRRQSWWLCSPSKYKCKYKNFLLNFVFGNWNKEFLEVFSKEILHLKNEMNEAGYFGWFRQLK